MDIESLKLEIDKFAIKEPVSKPVISVIIPAYNVESYIGDCLLSLIKQTFKDIELIVINDGSTDKTGEIIKLFEKDKRVKVITQQNKGVSEARNAGLNIAQSEYIGFIDSDDWVDENYYEKLYNAVCKYNADFGVTSILKHKIKYKKYNILYKKEKCVTSLKDKVKICEDKTHRIFYVWNKLYKRSLIEDNNLRFPAGKVFEDVSFSIRTIYYAKSIVSVPGTKYHYIERSNSIVKSKDVDGKKKADKAWTYSDMIEFAHEKNIILPDKLNYETSYWKTPLFKIYSGKYKKKITLFGLIALWSTKND